MHVNLSILAMALTAHVYIKFDTRKTIHSKFIITFLLKGMIKNAHLSVASSIAKEITNIKCDFVTVHFRHR